MRANRGTEIANLEPIFKMAGLERDDESCEKEDLAQYKQKLQSSALAWGEGSDAGVDSQKKKVREIGRSTASGRKTRVEEKRKGIGERLREVSRGY